ncbi:bifunctional diaminohydroxyphosphoribosylaminopyrimidine deaminase/5-amino-6-(5-phosphoribosylamino)uracil reductase RibD [Mucilaginibacter sp. HMF5004]|uniref:bifunctional diaminohydroxyphosphoribosylaminopyrimidine deaminase/5-amino-6-(5-phosphoribosylamino)uracil reductase RibD n=1 Tax=Mucilaginibacter rivuli TaxID=2857527 RepID=UPI001C5E767A|nr:bifunctional diaminohydroxyphosphoribosylaminopyrimidine deaminase/5-amino-6-(5-phosphoribosylamino)uracil reductase RibD [Mucilaginibacter rivuli]MBW4891644.1 bifunctional diaminohydroxyphosphoribosylaminopyrimidine deaminase/5-amino-6-(5-phosphoribosylamino)uracil reductase RibD [Mucilaginibacter rivuli]
MAEHHLYMQRALELARLGAGSVSPNPMVGAIIVHNGRIIGEGYHERYGQAHAEVNAVNDALAKYTNAEELLKHSTIYVTLEPCAHYGKTPPCADLIIKHGIPNVIVGCRDPFDQVNGKGIEKLIAAGVGVILGVMEEECLDLNKRFFTRVKKQRPYIILKWAETADGFFAPDDGSQFWITGDLAKRLVHQWRSEEDAILVGKNTALIDNPQLNVRYGSGKSPKRVVIDRNLDLPKHLNVFDKSVETIVFNAIKMEVDDNIKYISLEDFDNFVPQYILFQLYLQDIQSIIIEGGAKTLQSFIDAGLWDEARVFIGNIKLNNGIKSPVIQGDIVSSDSLGEDSLRIITPYAV